MAYTAILVSICLIPGAKYSIGKAAYLGAITTVFGHPGRRFGQMAEALILAISGTVLGVAWSTLGIYLGSLVIHENPPAAYTVRAIFLGIATMFHGYLRSRTPRLFLFVLLMIICAVVALTGVGKEVNPTGITSILYPILIAGGVIIVTNVCIFPEFSSGYLGETTIETLDATANAFSQAGNYFVGTTPSDNEQRGVHKASEGAADTSSNDSDIISNKETAPSSTRFVTACKKLLSRESRNSQDVEATAESKITIRDLTAVKGTIRQKVNGCKAAQSECNFELAISVLPPEDMKPISVEAMKKLAANVIAVIGTCESKYALLGEEELTESAHLGKREASNSNPTQSQAHIDLAVSKASKASREESEEDDNEDEAIEHEKSELERIKPRREIEFGDARLLQYLQRRIATPYRELQCVLSRTIEVITACLAFTYDVPRLPSGAKAPKGVSLEELDIRIDLLQRAAARFDVDTMSALEGAAVIQDIQGLEPDIMPREEIFLIASFILNVRQATAHIEAMLVHTHELVAHHQHRHGRRRLYAPRIKWASWLSTGGAEDESLPATGKKPMRKGERNAEDEDSEAQSISSRRTLLADQKRQLDLEKQGSQSEQEKKSTIAPKKTPAKEKEAHRPVSKILMIRGKMADILEWMQESEDLLYAIKIVISVFLVLWPAFVYRWNTWFSLNRGLWAGLQLIFIFEVAIGSSVMTFILRAVGTTIGCLWGWAAYEARNGNRIVCAAMICVGIFPCAYVQLGTPYAKAGMVAIVSMCIVAMATELETVPGTGTENFLKRWIAFMIGATVALIVEVVLLPVKARTRLVESLSATIRHIFDMEKCIAFGIEAGVKIDVFDPDTFQAFEVASAKANTALAAAETFLPFCSVEPRLKGSFEALSLIYAEIIFVLHQIIDRMDSMLQFRTVYGSGPLEELNADIFPYRRNTAGSITVIIFAVHGALVTKTPLPQFLPSARLAYLRLVNRVREVVLEQAREKNSKESEELTTKFARQRAVRRKYMAWNASSAAQIEIIEYLEELVDLTKLLVGATEFNAGLLTRENYREYATGAAGEPDQDPTSIKLVRNNLEQNKKKTVILTDDDGGEAETEGHDQFANRLPGDTASTTIRRRRTTTLLSSGPNKASTSVAGVRIGQRQRGTTLAASTASKGSHDIDDVPLSLQRIQTRKFEAGLKRQRTNDADTTAPTAPTAPAAASTTTTSPPAEGIVGDSGEVGSIGRGHK